MKTLRGPLRSLLSICAAGYGTLRTQDFQPDPQLRNSAHTKGTCRKTSFKSCFLSPWSLDCKPLSRTGSISVLDCMREIQLHKNSALAGVHLDIPRYHSLLQETCLRKGLCYSCTARMATSTSILSIYAVFGNQRKARGSSF